MLFSEVKSMDFYYNELIPLGLAVAAMDDSVDPDKVEHMTEAEKESLLNQVKDKGSKQQVQILINKLSND